MITAPEYKVKVKSQGQRNMMGKKIKRRGRKKGCIVIFLHLNKFNIFSLLLSSPSPQFDPSPSPGKYFGFHTEMTFVFLGLSPKL